MSPSTFLSATKSISGFDEPVNAISHLLGAVVFLVLSVKLIRSGRGNNRWHLACLAVFAFSCIFMLSISGVYHLLDSRGTAHAVMRRVDHAAIFLLIAGTFTPIHGILFAGRWRWVVLASVWCAAVIGITFVSVFLERMPPWLSVIFYLTLGWFGLISALKLYHRRGWGFIAPLVYGGISYTLGAAYLGVGALIDGLAIIPGVLGRHEVFHFAVLAGIGFHWRFVSNFSSCDTEASVRSSVIQQEN